MSIYLKDAAEILKQYFPSIDLKITQCHSLSYDRCFFPILFGFYGWKWPKTHAALFDHLRLPSARSEMRAYMASP